MNVIEVKETRLNSLKSIAGIRWLEERDPTVGPTIRRHLKVTSNGDELLIEGPADEVDHRRPNYNVFHGTFKHEHVTKGSKWKYVKTFEDNFNGLRHKYLDATSIFYIEDDFMAIEFKFFISDLVI
jgi:hypothetical protein